MRCSMGLKCGLLSKKKKKLNYQLTYLKTRCSEIYLQATVFERDEVDQNK